MPRGKTTNSTAGDKARKVAQYGHPVGFTTEALQNMGKKPKPGGTRKR